MKARNEATGVVVSADEATLRRLGPGWVVDAGDPPPAKKAPAKKAAPRKRTAKKSN